MKAWAYTLPFACLLSLTLLHLFQFHELQVMERDRLDPTVMIIIAEVSFGIRYLQFLPFQVRASIVSWVLN